LTACSVFQRAETPAAPLRIGFLKWWGNYTLLVAEEKDIFEKYDVQVEPFYYERYSDYTTDLASGQLDGAFLPMGDVININNFSPMKVVAVYDDGGADAIVVRPEINTIRDLQGKKVGVLIGTQYEMLISLMLGSDGLDSGDVIIVKVDPSEAVKALGDNRVQAIYTREPYLSQAVAAGNKIIYTLEKTRLFPGTIAFRGSIIEQRPDDVKAFLQAWFQAVEYRLQREGETRDIAAKYIGISADEIRPDNNLRILSLDDNKIIFDIQEVNSIYSTTKITSDYLISIGTITQEIDLLELIDPSFLP